MADLASLAAVRAMAAELAARGLRPEVLLHNAGVYMKQRERSVDGFEMTLAVNHLAPFLLTHLVLASAAGERATEIIVGASAWPGVGSLQARGRAPRRGGSAIAHGAPRCAPRLRPSLRQRRAGSCAAARRARWSWRWPRSP